MAQETAYCREVPKRIRVNLLDQQFGRLTVIGYGGPREYGRQGQTAIMWHCRCECGRVSLCSSGNLRGGYSKQCRHCGRKSHFVHGGSYTSLHRTWLRIRDDRSPEWDDFVAFRQAVGQRPNGNQLRKRDKSKPYGPGNFVWVNRYFTEAERAASLSKDVESTLAVMLATDPTLDAGQERVRLSSVSKQRRRQLRNVSQGKQRRCAMTDLNGPISAGLRDALEKMEGKTLLGLERTTGVAVSSLARFCHGGGLSMKYADALARHLGLSLQPNPEAEKCGAADS